MYQRREAEQVKHVQHSRARASLISIYAIFEPGRVLRAYVLLEHEVGEALAAAIWEFGLTIATTWLPNEDGGISNDEVLLPQGGTHDDPNDPGAPRAMPSGVSDVMSITSSLRIPFRPGYVCWRVQLFTVVHLESWGAKSCMYDLLRSSETSSILEYQY